MFFTIEYCAENAIENNPFKIERPDGSYRHIFFHFISQVTIRQNGENIICPPGTCIIYEPNVYQYFYVDQNRLNHDYIDFILEDKLFFDELEIPLNTPFNPKCSKVISNTLSKIIEERSDTNIGSNYKCQALMIDLFIEISRNISSKRKKIDGNYINTQKLKFEEIRLNIYQKPDSLKISDIANSIGFSVSRFNSLYKKYFNCTPIQDLTISRVNRVEELLNEGKTTKEIVKIIGFTSEEYFYRWFKKHFNTTKNQFINETKDIDI